MIQMNTPEDRGLPATAGGLQLGTQLINRWGEEREREKEGRGEGGRMDEQIEEWAYS